MEYVSMAQLEARGAHNPEVTRSKRVAAKHFAILEFRVQIDSKHKIGKSFIFWSIKFASIQKTPLCR